MRAILWLQRPIYRSEWTALFRPIGPAARIHVCLERCRQHTNPEFFYATHETGAELLRGSFLACVSSHNVALHGFQIHPRYEQRRVSVGANIQTLVASARLLLPRESVI